MKKMTIGSILLSICCIAGSVSAQEAKIELKPGTTIKEVLGDNTGKRVAIRLASGEEIEGIVTTVGNSLVHVSKLTGKDFYDSVVVLDKICAVRIKVRDK
jgi:hypothetical protein